MGALPFDRSRFSDNFGARISLWDALSVDFESDLDQIQCFGSQMWFKIDLQNLQFRDLGAMRVPKGSPDPADLAPTQQMLNYSRLLGC